MTDYEFGWISPVIGPPESGHVPIEVAQQLSATGQSLMQSQRLAKSVSQALVGGTFLCEMARAPTTLSAQLLRQLYLTKLITLGTE